MMFTNLNGLLKVYGHSITAGHCDVNSIEMYPGFKSTFQSRRLVQKWILS